MTIPLDKTGAAATLLRALVSPSTLDCHPIDLSPISRLYKSLLQGGRYNRTTNSIEHLSDAAAFASQFVKIVGRDATALEMEMEQL